MEIVSNLVTEVVKDLFITLIRQAGYLFHYKRNIKDLEREVEKLKGIRKDVEQLVEVAQRNNEVILDMVQTWLASVQCTIGDVQGLDDRAKGNMRFFDLKIWYKLGKEAKSKIAEVNDLQRVGNFSSVSHLKLNPKVRIMPDGDFSKFESTKSAMKQVIDALKDENINIIGVYGMGGVGKTTLVKQVAKQVEKELLFEEVVMVTLSQSLDLKSIQSDIAEQLDMRLENGSESMRARKLTQRLLQAKNVLVIFDNLWERLELANVGIPHGEGHKGCSIIFTTRSVEICNVMECQAKIVVNILSEQDSWSLFREKAGDVVNTLGLHDLAMNVAKECGGLPLAIVILGRALRDNKNKVVWKQVLQELQRSNPAHIKDMNAKVFTSLEMSYNNLESEEAKSCFLFCCLVPEGHSIHMHDLIRYGMGEGLFHNVNTLEEASGRVHTLIDKLKASCLLLEGKSDGWVKMHDVVRDVAISIASRHEHAFLVKAGMGLKEWPEIENPEQCKRISLPKNNFKALPDSISCPQLLTLLLDVNYSLRKIPESFFMRMKALRVLDLCDTNISSLPLSIECLENLRTLWLDRCRELRDVALIGRLKKLEILCLKKSGVDKFPKEIGELTNLKLLDLSNTKLEIIPPNVISRLIRLEELYMGHTFSQWEPKGEKDARKASIAEIEFLTRLNVLDVHVENINCMSQSSMNGPWKNLMKFQICIGGHYKYGKAQKFMKLENLSIPIPYFVKLLFDIASELHLVCCRGLTNFASTHEMRGENLESLTINECGEMEHVVSVEEEAPPLEFRSLERLFLLRLENLKKICIGPLAARCLINLRVLEVSICKNLINILPSYLVKVLCNLEKLVVDDCQELLEVFNSEDLVEEHALLTSLKKLKLENLPKLSSLWRGPIPMRSLHNLGELNVEWCENLISLFSNGEPPTGFLGNLRIFSVIECMKLTRVLPSNLIQGLEALEEVAVHHCFDLQELFSSRCLKGGSVLLPQLRKLDLCNLPMLTSIWEGDIPADSLCSLEAVYVTECHNLQYLFSPALAYCAAQPKVLSILRCEKMEKLIMEVTLPPTGCFQKLQKLSIYECHGFKSLFSSSLARNLTCLNNLIVQSCHGMEVIITKEEGVADMGVLPQLKSLRLVDLPKLTSFYEEVFILDFHSLEFISLWSCPDLKWVPIGPQSAPNLKEVLSVKWTELEELEWSDENVKSRLQSLFKEW